MEWDGEVNMRYQPWYISIPGKSTMRILSTYLHAGPSNTTVTTFHEPQVNHEPVVDQHHSLIFSLIQLLNQDISISQLAFFPSGVSL